VNQVSESLVYWQLTQLSGTELGTVSAKKAGSFPVKYDKSVTLLDQSLSCPKTGNVPAFKGGLKIGGFQMLM
jgi:hypothetical protein